MTTGGQRGGARALVASTLLLLSACGIMPRELNLSPLYYHRYDKHGELQELDVLWPIVHYERTPEGGDDFRVRPLYRRVTDPPGEDIDHQFLWPLGRVRNDPEETAIRLFPIWGSQSRLNDEGERDVDWFFTPLIWAGSSDGGEDYLAVLPFYADIPNFLTYDRFQTILFPLWVGLDKGTRSEDIFLWPLISTGGDPEGKPRKSGRVLPFYGSNVYEGRYERYTALWPFVHWGTENLETEDPIDQFFLWPLWGTKTSDKVDSWTFLWPFFSKMEMEDRLYKLDLLWPIFRYHERTSDFAYLKQWWIWPFYGQTETDDQRAWSVLWPLLWFRKYYDPEGIQTNDWIVPFYWRTHRERDDGTEDDFLKLWPFYSREIERSETGQWQVPSPWLWRGNNAEGIHEAYGWLWTLAEGSYGPDREKLQLAAKAMVTGEKDGLRQTSVPFLFNYESDADGSSTFRLLQFIPIPFLGSSAKEKR